MPVAEVPTAFSRFKVPFSGTFRTTRRLTDGLRRESSSNKVEEEAWLSAVPTLGRLPGITAAIVEKV